MNDLDSGDEYKSHSRVVLEGMGYKWKSREWFANTETGRWLIDDIKDDARIMVWNKVIIGAYIMVYLTIIMISPLFENMTGFSGFCIGGITGLFVSAIWFVPIMVILNAPFPDKNLENLTLMDMSKVYR